MLQIKDIKTKEFKQLLSKLVGADKNRIAVTELLQPKYDAILQDTLNNDFKGLKIAGSDRVQCAIDNEEFTPEWSNMYRLSDEVTDVVYSKMDVVIKESGFDLESGMCPILMAENELMNVYHEIRSYLSTKDSTYSKITQYYDINKQFEKTTLQFAYDKQK